MTRKQVGHTATLLLAALTVLAGLALPNGVGVPTGVGVGETAPADAGQDPWAVWSHKQYDSMDVKPFSRELFDRHIAPIDNSWNGWDGYVAEIDPTADHETQVMRFPTISLEGIVSSRKSADPAHQAHVRRVARHLIKEHVVHGTGSLAEMFNAGQIAGIEVDWHHADHLRPQSEMCLPVVGALFTATDHCDVLLAYIYAYSEPQLVMRKQELELNAGVAPLETTVWMAPILSAQNRVVFTGNDIQVAGDVHARRRITVAGENLSIAGTVAYGDAIVLQKVPTIDGPLVQPSGPIALAPVPFSVEEARAIAQQVGIYSPGDIYLTMPPPDGTVIFAEGDVHVQAWGWTTRSLTIFAKHSVYFEGADATLRGAESDTLAVAYMGDVRWSMTSASVEGLIASPNGDFVTEQGGSVFRGPITASWIELASDGNVFNGGTELFSDPWAIWGNGGGGGMPMTGAGEESPMTAPTSEGSESGSEDGTDSGSEGGADASGDLDSNGDTTTEEPAPTETNSETSKKGGGKKRR